jgi:hypothetical protein
MSLLFWHNLHTSLLAQSHYEKWWDLLSLFEALQKVFSHLKVGQARDERSSVDQGSHTVVVYNHVQNALR